MVPHANSEDRLSATREAIERDADDLRTRWCRARKDMTAAWGSVAGLGQLAASFVRRRSRDGDGVPPREDR